MTLDILDILDILLLWNSRNGRKTKPRNESEKWAPLKTNYRSGGQHEENVTPTHTRGSEKCTTDIKLHKVSRRTT